MGLAATKHGRHPQIAATKAKETPPELLAKYSRAIESTQEEGSEGGWVSFRKLAAAEGEEEIKAMLAAGTVQSRLNPKLQNTSIEFPWNQEICWNEEKWTSKRRKVEVKEDAMAAAPTAADAQATVPTNPT